MVTMPKNMQQGVDYICWFEEVCSEDVSSVGGKNASLGEMIRALKPRNIRVPDGFATTAQMYRDFVIQNRIGEKIGAQLQQMEQGKIDLAQAGQAIRELFKTSDFPADMDAAIRQAYRELSARYGKDAVDVAVRSSATAEDLPDASFAGQQESFLNIVGEEAVLKAVRNCMASLFTDRAISYRISKGFDHLEVALSVGIQKMVRSDLAGSGVMFSIDADTGFPDVVVINAAWGLGETIVQGAVNPDEYMVFKPLLKNNALLPIVEKALGSKERKMIYGKARATETLETTRQERESFVLADNEIMTLAHWACTIESHYDRPMDMEWAKDGETGELYIVQARPETVHSRMDNARVLRYKLSEENKGDARDLVQGVSIGDAIAAAKVCKIRSPKDIDQFEEGAILVTEMTDPDWVPIMEKAKGIITDQGGRTCHAAIVSRELGIPAIVATGSATSLLESGQEVTLSCAEGATGHVYEGILNFETEELSLDDVPETRTQVMINIASPDAALRWWRLPCEGIGLARMEFIINNTIQIHPMALIEFDKVKDPDERRRIETLTQGYADRQDYFVEKLARGIAQIAASQYPSHVIVRMSDFKTNEYAQLIGGSVFEATESNPMLGFRGASRYTHPKYRPAFDLECRAIKKVRDEMGLTNTVVMIPFCRTLAEADGVLEVLAENGLVRGENDLQLYVMAEVPSNIILAEKFAERFDGFSIGSNDLTQLTLGIDRDSSELAPLFDERNEAVMRSIAELIQKAHRVGAKVGICGQAPSDYPEFAQFLVEQGIDSISLNPDSVIPVKRRMAEVETKLRHDPMVLERI